MNVYPPVYSQSSHFGFSAHWGRPSTRPLAPQESQQRKTRERAPGASMGSVPPSGQPPGGRRGSPTRSPEMDGGAGFTLPSIRNLLSPPELESASQPAPYESDPRQPATRGSDGLQRSPQSYPPPGSRHSAAPVDPHAHGRSYPPPSADPFRPGAQAGYPPHGHEASAAPPAGSSYAPAGFAPNYHTRPPSQQDLPPARHAQQMNPHGPAVPPFQQPFLNQHHHYIAPSASAAFATPQAERYICPSCNKPFSRPSSLRIHTHSHTGEKPFKCPHEGCGRAFSVRSNMKRHERGCHGGESSTKQP